MPFRSCRLSRVRASADVVADGDFAIEDIANVPGAWFFWVRLPAHHRKTGRLETISRLIVYRAGTEPPTVPDNATMWSWDGERDLPSLRPSISRLVDGECLWHGWITAGRAIAVPSE